MGGDYQEVVCSNSVAHTQFYVTLHNVLVSCWKQLCVMELYSSGRFFQFAIVYGIKAVDVNIVVSSNSVVFLFTLPSFFNKIDDNYTNSRGIKERSLLLASLLEHTYQLLLLPDLGHKE